jgi:TRAP-type transport system periplasmic protein
MGADSESREGTAMRRTTICHTIALAIAAALAAGAAQAQVTTLRYASASSQKSIGGMQAERAADVVNEESKGTLKIELFLNAQLGSEQDTVQQVARGRIDMGGFSLNATALIVPEVQLLAMPFFFANAAELDCVIDTELNKTVAEMFAAKGVQLLSWGESGMVDLMGKKAYPTPADAHGVKAGSYGSKTYTIFWSTVGANPVAVTAPEYASSLQTGLIDVLATVRGGYVASGLNKIAPVLTRLDIAHLPSLNLMNKAAYDALSAEQREALARHYQRFPSSHRRREVREWEAQMLAKHEEGGGRIVQATPEQRRQWRDAIAPQWPKMVKEAGPGGEKFFEAMEAARKACEKR